ncbi:MAG: hypothetical protein AAB389_03275 [Patescibacteria group bacterium]
MGMEEPSVCGTGKSEESSVAKVESKKGGIKAWLKSHGLGLSISLSLVVIAGIVSVVVRESAIREQKKLFAEIEAARQKPVVHLQDWGQLMKYIGCEIVDIKPSSDGNSVVVAFGDCDYSEPGVEHLDKLFLNSDLLHKGKDFANGELAHWAARKLAYEAKLQLINQTKQLPILSFTELLSYDGCDFEVLLGAEGVCRIIRPGAEPKLVMMEESMWSPCYTSGGYKIDCEKIFAAAKKKAELVKQEAEWRQMLEETARELDKNRPVEK